MVVFLLKWKNGHIVKFGLSNWIWPWRSRSINPPTLWKAIWIKPSCFTHFAKYFSIVNYIRWRFHSDFIQVVVKWSYEILHMARCARSYSYSHMIPHDEVTVNQFSSNLYWKIFREICPWHFGDIRLNELGVDTHTHTTHTPHTHHTHCGPNRPWVICQIWYSLVIVEPNIQIHSVFIQSST